MSGMEDPFGQDVRKTRPHWHSLAQYTKEIERLAKQDPAYAAVTLLYFVHYRRLEARKRLANDFGIKVELAEQKLCARVVRPEVAPEDVDELISAMNDQTGEALKRLEGDDRIVGPVSAFSKDCGRAIWNSISLEILFDGMRKAGESSGSKAVCKVFVQILGALPVSFFGTFSMGPKNSPESRKATMWLSGWVASRTNLQYKSLENSLSSISDDSPRDTLLRELPAATLDAWEAGNGLEGLSTLVSRAVSSVKALGDEAYLKEKMKKRYLPEENATAGADDIELLHFEAHEAALKDNHRIEFLQLAEAAKLSKRERQLLEIELRLTAEHVDFHDSDIAREMGVKETTVRVWRHRYHRKIREAAA